MDGRAVEGRRAERRSGGPRLPGKLSSRFGVQLPLSRRPFVVGVDGEQSRMGRHLGQRTERRRSVVRQGTRRRTAVRPRVRSSLQLHPRHGPLGVVVVSRRRFVRAQRRLPRLDQRLVVEQRVRHHRPGRYRHVHRAIGRGRAADAHVRPRRKRDRQLLRTNPYGCIVRSRLGIGGRQHRQRLLEMHLAVDDRTGAARQGFGDVESVRRLLRRDVVPQGSRTGQDGTVGHWGGQGRPAPPREGAVVLEHGS
mmetsp:Transcript_19444/g.36394  ORF Transcript_19444/g.36394 Transcript_19444/m.36394 type:complete len:251 (-) Transcript_19444:1649-2401(-)